MAFAVRLCGDPGAPRRAACRRWTSAARINELAVDGFEAPSTLLAFERVVGRFPIKLYGFDRNRQRDVVTRSADLHLADHQAQGGLKPGDAPLPGH